MIQDYEEGVYLWLLVDKISSLDMHAAEFLAQLTTKITKLPMQ